MYLGLYDRNLLLEYERGVIAGIVEDASQSENVVASWLAIDHQIKRAYS